MPVASVALLLHLLSMAAAATAALAMDPAERETLLLVMEAVSSDRDWRSVGPDPCGSPWPGLECKPVPAAGNVSSAAARLHVTRLDFGVAPNPTCKDGAAFPHLAFALPHLQSLFLVDCFKNPAATTAFTLPPSANLTSSRLQQLSVRSNPSLSGTLPPQLSSIRSLQVLTVSQNALIRGEVPQGIGELKSLVHLDLSYNSLTGTIPSRIGELRSLVGLDLSYNSFSGSIPGQLGDLAMLQKLDLSSNNLTGGVPATITGLTSLTFLALSNNGLSGHLPAGLSDLLDLQYLIMENNPMGVPLPSELGDIARLQELRLANSGYSGSIPETLGRLASLTTLSLENNNLTGRIPAGLSRLKRMYHLNLSKNGLDGVVPFDGAFLRRLGRNLDLSGNPGLCVDGRAVLQADVGVGVCRRAGDGGDIASVSAATDVLSVGTLFRRDGQLWLAGGRWSALLLIRPVAVALCCSCCLLL
uniref:non-specific serine/threonine protein kinase n=1 Tax=Oryza nivara TaxID=4536 RepID=A0A0E0HH46_ORYNI